MHLKTSHHLAQWVIPHMKSKGFGRILNIISTSVRIPIHGLGVSNTVRGAMASWSKTLSNEIAKFGITVNNILPGFTNTERLDHLREHVAQTRGCSTDEVQQAWLKSIPAGRLAKPEEIAQAVAFLVSPSASYINGINLPIDGGRTGCL